jgi:hypothetical protein
LLFWLTSTRRALSFAGGLHWGLSMLHPEMTGRTRVFMAWSVVPALVGWISVDAGGPVSFY